MVVMVNLSPLLSVSVMAFLSPRSLLPVPLNFVLILTNWTDLFVFFLGRKDIDGRGLECGHVRRY